MQWVTIQFFIVLSLFSKPLVWAEYDNYQISGGGKSGKLLIDRDGVWRPICYTGYGFTDNLADTACVNIGYQRSTDVYPYTLARYTSGEGRPVICSIFCLHYEAKTLDECDLTIAINGYCQCNEVVGITCTNSLSIEEIVGIVVSVLALLTIVFILSSLFCCRCSPCYFKKCCSHNYEVTHRTRQEVTMMPTATTRQSPAPLAPPPYAADTGYQPVPPTATTAKY